MTDATGAIIAIVVVAAAAWAVPGAVMRGLIAELESSAPRVVNYRGAAVPTGLGVVWLVWAVSLLLGGALLTLAAQTWPIAERVAPSPLWDGLYALPLYIVPLMLVASTVALGLADDVFGSREYRGLRGHLRALAGGRLTTGTLKLFGIGAVALYYGLTSENAPGSLAWAPWVLGAGKGLVIALSANFLNLLDLRPGRALKAYTALVIVPGSLFALRAVEEYRSFAEAASGASVTGGDVAVVLAATTIALIGPVLAVWRYDLGERAMLGDAGSNAMGAVVGYLLAETLPPAGVAVAVVALVALTLLAERVSYSAIIERVRLLAYLDRLGRRDGAGAVDAGVGEVRYHADGDADEREA